MIQSKIMKKQVLSVIMIITIISPSFIGLISYLTKDINSSKENYPKSSDSEIQIITPANDTYYAGMSGYFPATYGFENDAIGKAPAEWNDTSNSNCASNVLMNKTGHKKVVELNDGSESGCAVLNKYFSSNQMLETIEFWYFPDNNLHSTVDLYSASGQPYISIQFLADIDCIRYLNGVYQVFYLNYQERWYHLRIDVDYSNDVFDVFVDGVKYVENGAFRNPSDTCSRVRFCTWIAGTGQVYVDAIGYSIDSNYEIGENLHEGLLLSFENSTNLDWISYSLDSNVNKTIMGNTTVSLPHRGTHSIQVFGNDTLGTIYQSEKRYFTMDYGLININTPESKAYFEPMDGYYPATSGFENDNSDTFPTGWFDESTGACNEWVEDEFQGHKKVMKLIDNDNIGSASIKNVLTGGDINIGVVEFWVYPNYTSWNGIVYFEMQDTSNTFYLMYIAADRLYYASRSAGGSEEWYYYQFSGASNVWHHISITFNTITDMARITIDGNPQPERRSFQATNQIHQIRFRTHPDIGAEPFSIYIDAIGYSWDPNYGIGDNQKDGLLLSFENSTTLTWMAYSLDGESKKQILGNVTFPFPENGPHFIQIYGKDNIGNFYESELRLFQVYFDVSIPDPPVVKIQNNIGFIRLYWDPPSDHGAPILNYKIYRGEVLNGSKNFIGDTSSTEYIDIPPQNDTIYYYVACAINAAGASDNSTEVSGQSYDQPFVEWITPLEGETVVFPYNASDDFNEWVQFHFEYNFGNLDTIELYIGNHNYGNVSKKEHVILLSEHVNGTSPIAAVLCGYNNTNWMFNDTHHFTFVNINFEVTEILNSSTQILGKQLYLILHDPHGDGSYSGFSQTTKLSMGIGCEITSAIGGSMEIGDFAELWGVEAGASVKIEGKVTQEEGYDFRFEVTDTTSLTSSQVTDDPDYIGPGYGDRYWGESWIYRWIVNATQRIYSNGTNRWEAPQIFYGIIRDAETFVSDEHAPPEWRTQNAVYNSSIPVQWVSYFSQSGGAHYTHEHEVTTTEARKTSFQIELGLDFRVKFPGLDSHVTLEMSVKNYAEQEQSNIFKVGYDIYDDDPQDFIVQGISLDIRFGTFLFNSMPLFCNSSRPYEHNTYDYLPPDIAFPVINYDSNMDGVAPTSTDSPFIMIDIFEEGGMQECIINYSIDSGLHWNIIHLHEQILNPGTWEASLPAQPSNTMILWYIMAWDLQGNKAIRKDIYGNPFEYTVIQKAETNPSNEIPSFPPLVTLLIAAGSIACIVFIHKKRHENLK